MPLLRASTHFFLMLVDDYELVVWMVHCGFPRQLSWVLTISTVAQSSVRSIVRRVRL